MRDGAMCDGAERGGAEPWHDLAGNEPGAMVRACADELRAQAPVLTFMARVLGVYTEERDFRVGADGEQKVAWRLRKLDRSRWHVIHSIPVGDRGCDIDHLVIGPPGVFSLNTKHHPRGRVWVGQKAVMVNGQETTYLRSSRFEADRASRLLSSACGFSVSVRPVIVIVAASITVRRQPNDVRVVGDRTVVRWLRRQDAVCSPGEVATIFERARHDTIWRPPARR